MGVKKSANDIFVDVRICGYANVQIFWMGMDGFLKMGGGYGQHGKSPGFKVVGFDHFKIRWIFTFIHSDSQNLRSYSLLNF